MATKTNKSYTKRLKLTKTGKLIARKPGFNHFNAKQSRTHQLNGKKGQEITLSPKEKGMFIPHN